MSDTIQITEAPDVTLTVDDSENEVTINITESTETIELTIFDINTDFNDLITNIDGGTF